MNLKNLNEIIERVKKLHKYSKDIARETQYDKLLAVILESMQDLTTADGGVLYILNNEKTKLKFEILFNKSLGIKMGGAAQTPVRFDDLPLYDSNQLPQLHNIACYSILKDSIMNIEDVYLGQGFDFSRIRKFDKLTRYRSKSLLIVPIKNHHDEMIGILQLVNAQNAQGEIISFTKEDEEFVSFLSSWAAVILSNYNLNEDLRKLFESVVEVLASAVDDKSAYTGGHCRRVPVIAMMIADAIEEMNYGPLKDFSLTEEDRYELQLAALLHDCGKVTTPVHIMDKATKLETIFDRIDLIDHRFEILCRDTEIAALREKIKILSGDKNPEKEKREDFLTIERDLHSKIEEIKDDREFIRKCNIGGEFMGREVQNRVRQIGDKYHWRNCDGMYDQFLSFDEVKNLTISRGTLTQEERETINHHAEMTLKMLTQMHFPKHLCRIPEIASCHHERINGQGYPRGLKGGEMSVQAKLMGVADIFEALTAKDRPYKRGKTLTETLLIMGQMKLDQHIDADIFDIFIDKKVYIKYAEKYLDDYQCDQVDISKIPGYVQPEKRYSATEKKENEREDYSKKVA